MRVFECLIKLKVPLPTTDQLENEAQKFLTKIQQAVWNNTPFEKKTTNNTSINYPLEVRQLVNEKTKAGKKWQLSRASQDKTMLNRSSNQLKELLAEIKNQSVSTYLERLTAEKSTEYSLWKDMRGLKRPKVQAPLIRKDNND